MSPSTATVLTTAIGPLDIEQPLLAKRWLGPTECAPYDNAAWFTSKQYAAGNIDQLEALAHDLLHRPHSCIIHGAPVAGLDTRKPHLRRAKDRDDQAHTYSEAPRLRVLLDRDKTRWKSDPRTEPLALAREVAASLPPPFAGCACVIRFSSSAGMKPLFGVHVELVLAEPMLPSEVGAYLGQFKTSHNIDASVCRVVQPQFTAAPLFCGDLKDPCSVRIVRVSGRATVDPRPIRAEAKRRLLLANIEERGRQLRLAMARVRRAELGAPTGPRATCEQVAHHAGIVTESHKSELLCDCPVHGSTSGKSLVIDTTKDCWICWGCTSAHGAPVGGGAWALAKHLLGTSATEGDIIEHLKAIA